MKAAELKTVGGLDWRDAIRRGRVETNEVGAQISLAVARLRLLRAFRRRMINGGAIL